jgi:hypothetical protein
MYHYSFIYRWRWRKIDYEKESRRITGVVNAFGVTDCLSKIINSIQGSLTARSYSQISNDIKYMYRLSKRWLDNKTDKTTSYLTSPVRQNGIWIWYDSEIWQWQSAISGRKRLLISKREVSEQPTFINNSSRDSSVCIATRYGLDGTGIEFRWQRGFPHQSRPSLGPTQPPSSVLTGLFPEGKAAGTWRWPPTLSRGWG